MTEPRSNRKDESVRKHERDLIRRFKSGESKVFDELVSACTEKLYRTAYGLLGNHQDAEEVVQDTFIRAYRSLPDFRGDSTLETWLYRITINLALNKVHWNKTRGEGINFSISMAAESINEGKKDTDKEIPDNMSPDRIMGNKELENNILSAIRNLPEKLREAMVLRHVEELPYEDIAKALDCKVGTIKSRLSRGREMLKNNLEKAENRKHKRSNHG